MIELTRAIVAEGGLLVPAGARLDFKNGVAKFQNHRIYRQLVPLEVIKGAAGPFLHACSANLLNVNTRFQELFKKQYPDWAHFVVKGDNIIVYVWDTREVIDIVGGLLSGAKGGPVTRTLINKDTGERLVQVLGHNRWGWSKSVYEMMFNPKWKRPDNGLPLVCKDAGWAEIVNDFNDGLTKKYVYESLDSLEVLVQATLSGACEAAKLRKAYVALEAQMPSQLVGTMKPSELTPNKYFVMLDDAAVASIDNAEFVSDNMLQPAMSDKPISVSDVRFGEAEPLELRGLDLDDLVEVDELLATITEKLSK